MGLFGRLFGGHSGRSERFPGIDWWCDRCGALLNDQLGFDDHKYIWKCTECGYKNSISADNIEYGDDDDDDYDDDDCSERLSVDDAALIWFSNGMDEDYMFGYTEEELRDALE